MFTFWRSVSTTEALSISSGISLRTYLARAFLRRRCITRAYTTLWLGNSSFSRGLSARQTTQLNLSRQGLSRNWRPQSLKTQLLCFPRSRRPFMWAHRKHCQENALDDVSTYSKSNYSRSEVPKSVYSQEILREHHWQFMFVNRLGWYSSRKSWAFVEAFFLLLRTPNQFALLSHNNLRISSIKKRIRGLQESERSPLWR